STVGLRAWLEERRAELEVREGVLPRPDLLSGEASDSVEEHTAEVQEVFGRLTEYLPEDHDAWDEDERSRWLLAHELEYFRREDKCAW
ncbi:MAG: hypothetical protein KAY24_10040, partial [Candidatus Eisenbacteria sp.]|nr:hypothetical protein [Candidatus Eisenbacteria bacterium]